jgi:Ribonuclease G/E
MPLYVSESFFEKRALLTDSENRAQALFFQFPFRPNLGEIYAGRVTEKIAKLNAFFVDLGSGKSGYLSIKENLTIGAFVVVEVIKEPRADKLANLKLLEKKCPEKIKTPELLAAAVLENRILKELAEKKQSDILIPDSFPEDVFDEALEQALSPCVSFSCGARVHFDKMHACVGIDVDSGQSLDRIENLNAAAVPVIARQIRLANDAGNFIVDFIGSKKEVFMKPLLTQLKTALLKEGIETGPINLSPLGLVEFVRKRQAAPVSSMLSGAQWDILSLFRSMNRLQKRGGRLKRIEVSETVFALLNSMFLKYYQKVAASFAEPIALSVRKEEKFPPFELVER